MIVLLSKLKKEIATMNRLRRDEREKPHKLFMLLAVLELAAEGKLSSNKIYCDEQLISRFNKFFTLGADSTDWPQPGPPFFHLRSSFFWHHKPKEGREKEYAALKRVGGGLRVIKENIEYAYFSDEVFALIQDKGLRNNLRDFIIALFPPEVVSRINHD